MISPNSKKQNSSSLFRAKSWSLVCGCWGIMLCSFQTQFAEASFTLPVSLDGTTNHSAYEDYDYGWSVSDSFGVTADSFTTDFADPNNTSFNMELSVDEGQWIDVMLPAGASGTLEVFLNYTSVGTFNGSNTPNYSWQFLGVNGPTPVINTSNSGVSYRRSGQQLNILGAFQFTESFTFTGLSLSIEGPFTSNGGTKTYSADDASFTFNYYDLSGDPGGALARVVPEPSSFATLGISVIALMFRRRR
ncbi:MAG: PEP-CTERM sorting domain-containing protein [Akkermansiaceae bacterium]